MSVATKHITPLLLCALTLVCGALLYGCSRGTDDLYPDPVDPFAHARTYITLDICTLGGDASTRANPTGGNEGDGREEGINNENNIYDLTFFLYESTTGDGINGADNPALTMSHYLSGIGFTGTSANSYTYKTAPIEVKGISVTDNTHIIVVANGGDWTQKGFTTLNDLRQHITTEKVVTTASTLSTYGSFVMASSVTAHFTVTGTGGQRLGTYDDPAHVSTTIERLAARIDIQPNATFDATNIYYEYTVSDMSGDKVRATHITPFNCWQPAGGQYLLKRVSSDGTEVNRQYLTKETPDAGVQTNYVLSPYMNTDKKLIYWNANRSTVEGWYRNPILAITTTRPVEAATYPDAISSKDYYILDYTQENTLLQVQQLNCFTTGIVLQAYYVPATLYDASDNTVAYTPKTDFWFKDGKFYNYARAGAVKYINGICYYRYYIRHSNDNVTGTMGVMEYGIVRNNIYRLEINSFSRIGDPKPDPDDPTDMDEYLNIRLVVRPWSTRTHTTIIM